jgi:Tol biopolymer transport system component
VVFNSHASDLVPEDHNGKIDVFVRSLPEGPTLRVSRSLSGQEANGDSVSPGISGDGRLVVFASDADNLVPGDRNGARDVFLHDRQTGSTVRLSVSRGGAEADGASDAPAISADGRLVAFSSEATNLTAGAPPVARGVFVLDRESGHVEAVSAGLGPAERADLPALDGDGSRVAFVAQRSAAEGSDVFLLDRPSRRVLRVSVAPSGADANDESGVWGIALSADGACVAFTSLASNLVPDDDVRAGLFVARLPAAP